MLKHTLLTLYVAMFALLLVGCGGGDPLDRQPISGTVSFRGAPLTAGAIQFFPEEAGSTSGGSIRDGAFQVTADEGLPPGRYRVEIVSYQPTGTTRPDSDNPGETIEVHEQVIPPEFNARSTQTVEVTADANHFEWAIP